MERWRGAPHSALAWMRARVGARQRTCLFLPPLQRLLTTLMIMMITMITMTDNARTRGVRCSGTDFRRGR